SPTTTAQLIRVFQRNIAAASQLTHFGCSYHCGLTPPTNHRRHQNQKARRGSTGGLLSNDEAMGAIAAYPLSQPLIRRMLTALRRNVICCTCISTVPSYTTCSGLRRHQIKRDSCRSIRGNRNANGASCTADRCHASCA